MLMAKQVNPSLKSFQEIFLGRGRNKWQEAEKYECQHQHQNPFAIHSLSTIHPSVYLSSAPVPSFASSSAFHGSTNTTKTTTDVASHRRRDHHRSLTSSLPCHSISISPLFNTLFLLFPRHPSLLYLSPLGVDRMEARVLAYREREVAGISAKFS